MNTEPQFMECNGVAMRYAVSGTGPKTLFLVHELAGTLNSWDEFVTLLPADIRAIRFDLRGSGMSEKIRGTLSFKDVCVDMNSLLDALGTNGPVVVAGAAMGAAIACEFALAYPQRCSAIALLSPALGVPAERQAAALALADKLEQTGLRGISADVFPKAFPANLWKNEEIQKTVEARWLGADPFGYAASYRALATSDIKSRLDGIACPVLALAGRYDPFGTPEIVENAVEPIANKQFEVVEGGHFMSVQNPERVVAAMLPFLNAA